MEVSYQLHAQAALSLGKEPPGIRRVGGWVGPRVGLDTGESILLYHNIVRIQFILLYEVI
jgi:hypothetical protein